MVKHLQMTLLHHQKMTFLWRMVLHYRKRTKRLQMGKRRRRRVRRVATPVEETKKLRSNFCSDDFHLEKIPTCVFSFPQLH